MEPLLFVRLSEKIMRQCKVRVHFQRLLVLADGPVGITLEIHNQAHGSQNGQREWIVPARQFDLLSSFGKPPERHPMMNGIPVWRCPGLRVQGYLFLEGL